MIDRATIAALVAHAGTMCLWDAVSHWDAQRIVLHAHGHRDPAHPLRSGGRLRPVFAQVHRAQAMAVHGGLLARARGGVAPPGMLVALRGVALHVARIDDLPGALDCEAEALVASDSAQQYRFAIHHAGTLLAEGRAAVMLNPGSPA